MRWPWTRRDENRGTLTFLPDGILIVGLPKDIDQETAYLVKTGLGEWLRRLDDEVLVLPFPVDVVDKR